MSRSERSFSSLLHERSMSFYSETATAPSEEGAVNWEIRSGLRVSLLARKPRCQDPQSGGGGLGNLC